MVLKYSFLRVLFEWSHTLDTSDEHSFVNVIGSLFFKNLLFSLCNSLGTFVYTSCLFNKNTTN